MAKLIFNEEGKEKIFTMKAEEITIGRSSSNNLILSDPTVSRNHAKVVFAEGEYIILDLGSKNGTQVNDIRINKITLKDNDRIRIGNTTLVFRTEAKLQVFYLKKDTDIVKSSSIIKPLPSSAELYTKEHKKLQIVYNISKAISAILDHEKLVEKVMELLFDIIEAERILIILKDQSTGKLIPKMAKRRDGSLEKEMTVSQTMVNRVVSEGLSVLVSDAQHDERFKQAQSLILKGVRSVMCVPLWSKETIFGLLYVDSHAIKSMFCEEDLDLLTAIGNQVAVALENLEAQEELFKKRRFEHELEMAADIQQSFLPSAFPEITGFKFAAKSIPALNVGGDFYDFFELPEGKWGFVVGDVAGKGIPAALYMARFISDFHRLLSVSFDVTQLLSNMNDLLLERTKGDTFVAATYVVLDTKASCLFFSRAGHHPPKVFRTEEGKVVDLVSPPGAPLGVSEKASFEKGQIPLSRGDIVIVYTDGLSEAQNERKEFLGEERLNQIIKKYHKLPPDEMINQILMEVSEYMGGTQQQDDQTILVIKKD